MTNEQILPCPVCGKGMKSEKGKPVLICRNNKCEFLGIMWPIKSIEAMNALIQSRINKEKAAAVADALGFANAISNKHLQEHIQERIDAAMIAERVRIITTQERYNKILAAVQSKYEGEERWETALRYIQEAEDRNELYLIMATHNGNAT